MDCNHYTASKGSPQSRNSPFPRPPVFAAYFAEATKANLFPPPVRPNGCSKGIPPKANSWQYPLGFVGARIERDQR